MARRGWRVAGTRCGPEYRRNHAVLLEVCLGEGDGELREHEDHELPCGIEVDDPGVDRPGKPARDNELGEHPQRFECKASR